MPQSPLAKKQSRAAPEIDTGFNKKQAVKAQNFMVATANIHASRAGQDILRQGGSAIDAAIAAQLVLTLVEPQSSGIGGGAFLLHYDASGQELVSFDGRETAPSGVTEQLFLRDDGNALGFGEAVRSGRSIGVPGIVAMLELAHKAHGKLDWEKLFEPAIILAENGFSLSPRLHKMLKNKGAGFFNLEAQELFYNDDNSPLAIGDILKNPALAQTYRLIAAKGARAFYSGDMARAIIDTAKKAPEVASKMSLEDLGAYKAKTRPVVCGTYRSFKVCGMGPPSSGGLTVAMTLALVEPFDMGQRPLNAEALHLIAEAEKLSFADRNHFMADPDFVQQPKGFLYPHYLKGRRRAIDLARAINKAEPGNVPLLEKSHYGQDATFENGGTSHLSIIDKAGNIVSMTSSIEGAFGSGQMVKGFLLNNQLTDFSFKPRDKEGRLIANRVQPGKRPRSSMAPTIVFDTRDEARLILGSPGGSRIILFVIKALIGHIDWGLGPQEAVSLLNFGSRNGPFELEKSDASDTLKKALESYGQNVRLAVMTSGAQMIVIGEDALIGGADPRREGVVLGD